MADGWSLSTFAGHFLFAPTTRAVFHAKPVLLPWPKPMALDNHWVLLTIAHAYPIDFNNQLDDIDCYI
jgi:hypothetical protein